MTSSERPVTAERFRKTIDDNDEVELLPHALF